MTMLPPGAPWANTKAIDGALSRGFDLTRGDWRDVFLAITDQNAIDGEQSLAARTVHAEFVGPLRDGERWTITFSGRRFDVLYEPHRALIAGVTDTRRGAPPVIAIPRPTRPRPPVGAMVAAEARNADHHREHAESSAGG